MISADEARKLTGTFVDVQYKEQMEIVEEAIRSACRDGKWSCYVRIALIDSVIRALQEDGYTARNTSGPQEAHISWL